MEKAEYAWKVWNPIGSKPDFARALPNLLKESPLPLYSVENALFRLLVEVF